MRWLADYEKAECRVQETGQDLLVYFHSNDPKRSKITDLSLASPRVMARLDTFVCTTLVKSYEPDRRYVAQYGVTRAPALIVVRADGTYHAKTGELTEEQVLSFLEDAQATGSRPRSNPYVPRRAPYHWHDDVGTALAVAANRGTATFVVYYRSWSRDWPKIKKMLTRHEVAGRLRNLVHCRIATKNPTAKAYITPFGAVMLPAMILANTDGTFAALESPTSSEAIARFLDDQSNPIHPNVPYTTSKQLDSASAQQGSAQSNATNGNPGHGQPLQANPSGTKQ